MTHSLRGKQRGGGNGDGESNEWEEGERGVGIYWEQTFVECRRRSPSHESSDRVVCSIRLIEVAQWLRLKGDCNLLSAQQGSAPQSYPHILVVYIVR
jgi:hypothetical protein